MNSSQKVHSDGAPQLFDEQILLPIERGQIALESQMNEKTVGVQAAS